MSDSFRLYTISDKKLLAEAWLNKIKTNSDENILLDTKFILPKKITNHEKEALLLI